MASTSELLVLLRSIRIRGFYRSLTWLLMCQIIGARELTEPMTPLDTSINDYYYLVKLNGALRRLVSELNTVTCTVCPAAIN